MLGKLWKVLLVLGVLLAFAAPAMAGKPPADDEEQVFDFEGDEISTDVLKPDTGVVETIVRKERKSLIKLRLDFVDEIVRSAEDI